jgi:Ion channel
MSIFIAAAVTLGLVLTNVLVHYEVLYGASRLIPRLSIPVRTRMLVVIMACLFAHVIEITLFGLAYLLLQQRLGIGSISGETDGSFLDFFYFSAATYSTLGLGDVFPFGSWPVSKLCRDSS